MTDITGSINEVRKTFTGDGTTGHVEFGWTIRQAKGGINGNCFAFTTVRVDLADGRKAFGRYHDAKNVHLTLKAGYTKAKRALK